MDFLKMLQKGILGFFTGLAAVIVFGVVQSITNYQPTICTKEVVENCTPQFVATAYYAIVPVITGFLVGVGNWLKNRGK